MKKVKNVMIFILVLILVNIIFSNYKIFTSPTEELYRRILWGDYYEWQIDLLLDNGADPSYEDAGIYVHFFQTKDYSLLEKVGPFVSDTDKVKIYQLSIKYALSDEIDEKLKDSLKID